jgi:hypothetical protein
MSTPDEPDPPRKFYKLKEAEFDRVNVPTNTPDTNEVHEVLRENLDRANAAGLNDVTPPAKRRSRRKRDYWIMMILVCGFFGAALAHFGIATIPGVYALAGIILFSCSLTWVMWFIMDDY